MAYTIYKLVGYKPYWTNDSISVPDKHIEDIVVNTGATWEKVSNSVEWSYPMEQATLITTKEENPLYIKIDDGKTSYYFYFQNWYETTGVNENGINLRAIYALDKYMTIFYNKLQILKDNNPSVKHLFKFTDRILYTENEDGTAANVEINFYKQKQFGNTVNNKEYQLIRQKAFNTTADELLELNKGSRASKSYNGVIISKTTTSDWMKNGFALYIDDRDNPYPDILKVKGINTPNKNNRYGYIVCKSSAIENIKTGGSKKTAATDEKILIPVGNYMLYELKGDSTINYSKDATITPDKLFNALLNIDFTKEQANCLNALSEDNFIGYFECDIPPALFINYMIGIKDNYNKWADFPRVFITLQEPNHTSTFFMSSMWIMTEPVRWVSQEKIAPNISIATNVLIDGTTFNIPYIKVGTNDAMYIQVINESQQGESLSGKLWHIISNLNKWNPDTEPMMLNPSYYRESYKVSSSNETTIDMSMIKYSIDNPSTFVGVPMYAYIFPDNTMNISYNFKDFNNLLNTTWDNKLSNYRAEISNNIGTYGSAAGTYYANNVNSARTSLYTRKAESGMGVFSSVLSAVFNPIGSIFTAIKGGNPFITQKGAIAGAITKGVSGLAGIGMEIGQQDLKNKELSASISNIYESPSPILSTPYIEGSIPNYENTLFTTYALELHPWDKKELFTYLANNGYPYNNVDKFNSYDNRKYMNVLYIDSSDNRDYLLEILNKNDNTIFNEIPYNLEFILWLGSLHRLYKTDNLINCTMIDNDDYQDNIENHLPIINVSTSGSDS